jgi:transcriptional regulator with XRE-family HTH domain
MNESATLSTSATYTTIESLAASRAALPPSFSLHLVVSSWSDLDVLRTSGTSALQVNMGPDEIPSRLLKRMKTDAGLSLRDIASALGVSPNAVQKWTHGGLPTADNRTRIAVLSRLVMEAVAGRGQSDAKSYLVDQAGDEPSRLDTIALKAAQTTNRNGRPISALMTLLPDDQPDPEPGIRSARNRVRGAGPISKKRA